MAMVGMTDLMEDLVLGEIFGTTQTVRPAAIYIGLFTVAPTVDAGTGGTEVSNAGTNYVRIAVTQADAQWTGLTAATGVISNANPILFPATGVTDWGATVVGVGIFDAVTSGNLLFYGPLSTPRTVVVGDTFQFAADALTISLD